MTAPAPHADETPVQPLAPGRGKTQRAYLRAYRSHDLEGDPPIVVFDYPVSRAGRHAWRARYAQPRRRLYHAWLGKTRLTVPDGSGTAKVIDYTSPSSRPCWARPNATVSTPPPGGGTPWKTPDLAEQPSG